MSVLDDLKLIHHRDAQDALGVAAGQWKQLAHNYNVDLSKLDFKKPENMVVAGMGGSALAATFLSSWPGMQIPFEVVRNYSLPTYVDEKTLFVASSYSGNTEESLEALSEAKDKGCQIIIIAAGGKLAKIADENNYPFFKIPSGLQPRMAVFYNFAALIQLLNAQIQADVLKGNLLDASKWVEKQQANWLPDVATKDNPAKQLAHELMGRSVVVYAGPKLFPAAYKWKISINENAKNVAWCNQFPEFNHNEFLGWTSHPTEKPYAVIELRSNLEHKRTQKRFEVTERLLSGKRPAPEIVNVQGKDELQQLLWAVTFGDFVSLYLAILNGLNPTPVDLIEKFKKALND